MPSRSFRESINSFGSPIFSDPIFFLNSHMKPPFASFKHNDVLIRQHEYPRALSNQETKAHDIAMEEYADELYQVMMASLEETRPNLDLYRSQPYITPAIRLKLIDFALKLLVRLKILPFVFSQGVKIFDRYCLSRIVVLAHAQLAVTTCLWIAAKTAGGNNHFANLECPDVESIKTISDLSHGSGARYLGPTERFRHPRLNELVKLCGSKCNYDDAMFIQMELHILNALDWNFASPCISDYIIASRELRVVREGLDMDNGSVEMFRIKRFVTYASCYLFELVKYDTLQIATVLLDLINDTLQLQPRDTLYQRLRIRSSNGIIDYTTYYHIRRHLESAIINASPYLLTMFDTRGPQLVHSILNSNHKNATLNSPLSQPSISSASVTDCSEANYTYMSSEAGNDSMQDAVPEFYNEAVPNYPQVCDTEDFRDNTKQEMLLGVNIPVAPYSAEYLSSNHCKRESKSMLQTPETEKYYHNRDFRF